MEICLESYREYLVSEHKSEKTINMYIGYVRKFKNHLAAKSQSDNCMYDIKQIQNYIELIKHGSYAMSTVATIEKALRSFLQWAASEGLAEPMPVIPKNAVAVDERFKPFRQWLEQKGKKKRTIDTYMSNITNFARWFDEEMGRQFYPEVLTPYDVVRYRRCLIEEKRRKPGGINTELVGLRVYGKYLASTGVLPINPVAETESLLLPRAQGEIKWLNESEQYRLIREVKSRGTIKELALILIMLDAGLRVEEVSNLRKEQVVLYPLAEARIEVLYGKWDRTRVVPLGSKRLHQALRDYDKNEREKREYLFCSQLGNKFTVRGIQHVMEKWAQKATLEGLSAHRLRHSFCYNLARAGCRLDEIALLAGHLKKNGEPNLDSVAIYIKASQHELRKAVRSLGI